MFWMTQAAPIAAAVPAQRALVDLIETQYTSLEELGASLTPSEWHQRASLPGWSVFDIYAHIIGTESMMEGREPPEVKVDVERLAHVRNDVGVINETWIEALSDLTPDEMVQQYREIIAARMRSLRSMSAEAFNAQTVTPVGLAPYWRFLQMRIFDCWMHEQDVRESLVRPGNESGRCAEAAVDEVERAIGFLIGKKADAPSGSTVTIELTGPVYRTIHVEVLDQAAQVDRLEGPPTSRVVLTSSLFMRLIGGRTDALASRLGALEFEGDLGLARQIVGNLAFTL